MRIGVDIGGTFTDCAVIDDTGNVWTAKTLSTGDAVTGVLNAIRGAADTMGLALEEACAAADMFVHGTTIGTNAVLQRKGGRTGLITTRGHEDTMIFGRLSLKKAGLSPQEIIHMSQLLRPEPIVPRDWIVGVNERVDRDGDVLVPLNEAEVADAVRTLVEEHHIQALAVSFLWSFIRPDHEELVKKIALSLYPDLFVTTSSELAPIIGEYERTVSAVLNAYIGVPMKAYVEVLAEKLRTLGYTGTPLVMEAGGGIAPAWHAVESPIVTFDSGPVGGVIGARFFAAAAGESNVICTDMGGTSFEVALVADGRPEIAEVPVIGKYTYQLSKISVESVGAGGGSIAHVDEAGIVHVGPLSAGSEPGPACYGRGGRQPTVTDADVVLGYMSARNFRRSGLYLDTEAAVVAIEPIATRLGVSTVDAAAAIVDIANAHMADLVRKQTIASGRDPRDFVLFAYGGAGPAHGGLFGEDLGAKAVYFVHNAGVFSALGMLTSDVSFTESASALFVSPFGKHDTAEIVSLFAQMEERVLERFEAADLKPEQVDLVRFFRGRFIGQVNEFELEFTEEMSTADGPALVESFVKAYERHYGPNTAYAVGGLEILTFRLVGTSRTQPVKLSTHNSPSAGAPVENAIVERRPIFCQRQRMLVEAAVYDGDQLEPGARISGLAVVERATDTVVIPAGAVATCDPQLNLIMRFETGGADRG